MGKADRNRDVSARAKIAQQQAAMRQSEQRRRLILVGGAVALVIVIVVVIVVIKGLSKTTTPREISHPLPASVATNIASIPVSTLAKIGTGAAVATNLRRISDTTLTSVQGKPEMLYIGAEYCPYCAAARWSMAVALSRFGTFGPLRGIHSSSTDVYPNTATLTFYQQKYSSPYVTFTPVENEDLAGKQLQQVTKAQLAIWAKYDTQASGGLGYPFVYFGGKVIINGPLYDPAVLHRLTWSQIAAQLSNPKSAVARNVNGEANYMTASICKMTNNSPSGVCKTAPIPAIEAKI